jgi:hypothetical protein
MQHRQVETYTRKPSGRASQRRIHHPYYLHHIAYLVGKDEIQDVLRHTTREEALLDDRVRLLDKVYIACSVSHDATQTS